MDLQPDSIGGSFVWSEDLYQCLCMQMVYGSRKWGDFILEVTGAAAVERPPHVGLLFVFMWMQNC